MKDAPFPARGSYADGFEPVARIFAAQLASGEERGAAFAVYQHGRRVVHLWGGDAHAPRGRAWEPDTRVVVYSVTKGLAAMGLALLADRGRLAWDAPVASAWPAFAARGKERVTFRDLFNHRAGLAVLDERFSLAECADPATRPRLVAALAGQRPRGAQQAYHATTFGMYASEVFELLAGEPLGPFLTRELFAPLGADVALGTSPEDDARVATVFEPSMRERAVAMARAGLARLRGEAHGPWTEGRIARALLARDSLVRGAFGNPRVGRGIASYARPSIWRAPLAWASATGTADGIARAYLPFALGGEVDGRRYLRASTIAPVFERQGWSERDGVLHKPLGWSQGFLKEQTHLFSPMRESFGHAGLGGSLGWCDPVRGLTIGYVMNRLDWRTRSPRALALTHALEACEPIRAARFTSG
ncbi:MAG: beta-lactamase family protein [Deltaproteobacteria bacterium]|nr:beta-lactamase family protein [Deltaproteobacteria bacterium]